MHSQKNRNMAKTAAIVIISVTLLLLSAVGACARTITVLYKFTGGKDGANPKARLLLDPKGNLFGTTTAGGAYGWGEVFELTPSRRGGWMIQVIYSFQNGADGALPAAGLIRDAKGNLYGTVYNGGNLGHGAVFELSPTKTGTWTKQLLYSFSGGNDGGQPVGGLIFDKAGNLYGTTPLDGLDGQGVVYELSPNGSGGWTETVLHSFVSQTSTDGQGPSGSLVIDTAGSLYGLTVQGGSANQGTVFKVSPDGHGGWTESLIYSFLGGGDGANPATSDLILKGATLYGTTTGGGSAGFGTIFKLTYSKPKAQWQETVLYTFPGGAHGGNPYAGLVSDPAGNLYGTTASGVYHKGGVVFELVKGLNNTWTEKVLYTVDNPGNGSYAGLVRDKAGNLYGTTEFGGPAFAGDVFEVTP
jgi:uncharacterized repeat protein (TIGR03803 family)